jgi:hypothetical protein
VRRRNQRFEEESGTDLRKDEQMTQRKWCWKETEELVGELNLVIEGWGNLLPAGIDEQSLPERGSSYTEPAASMVVPQA